MSSLPPISCSSHSGLPTIKLDSSRLLSISTGNQSSSFQSNQSLLSCIDEATGKLCKGQERKFLDGIDNLFSGYAHSEVLKKEYPNEYLCNIAIKLLSSSRCNSKQTSLSKIELPVNAQWRFYII